MRVRLMLGALIATGLLASVSGQAPVPVDTSKIGPQTGATVPAFAAVDQTGATRTLESLYGPKGLMLVFNRSVDW